jgi:hypothetical protein
MSNIQQGASRIMRRVEADIKVFGTMTGKRVTLSLPKFLRDSALE